MAEVAAAEPTPNSVCPPHNATVDDCTFIWKRTSFDLDGVKHVSYICSVCAEEIDSPMSLVLGKMQRHATACSTGG